MRRRNLRRYNHEPTPDPDFFRPPRVQMGQEQLRVYLGRYAKLRNNSKGLNLRIRFVMGHPVWFA